MFFDDVLVPVDRTLGDEGQGWAVAMDLLPFERSTALVAPRRLPAPHARGAARRRPSRVRCGRTRWARCSSSSSPSGPGPRATQHRMAAGEHARPRDLDRQDPARHRRSRRSSTSPSTASPTTCCSATTPAASGGARGTSTPAPPRSTAAAPRSSATSSPAASSTSDRTDDGRRGARPLRQGHPARHHDRAPAPTSTPRSTTSAGATPSSPDPATTVATLFEHQGAAGHHLVGARRRRWPTALGVDLDGSPSCSPPSAPSPRPATGSLDRARSGDWRRPRPSRAPWWSSDDGIAHVVDTASLERPRRRRARPAPRPRRGRPAPAARRRRRRRSATPAGRTRWPPASGPSPTSWSASPGRCSRLAREHALERVQFDRPIAGFQAVRHRLAEGLVAIEAADAAAARGVGRRHAAHAAAGQGHRRPQRPHRRPPQPAGAGRHRLHDRAPAAPLRAASPRARPPPRRRPLAHRRPRCGAAPRTAAYRRCFRSEPRNDRSGWGASYPSASIASLTTPAAASGIAVAASSRTSSRAPGISARSSRRCRRGRTGRGGRGRRAWGPRSRPGARATGACSRAWRTPCPSGWPSGPRVWCRACGPRSSRRSSAPRRGRRPGSPRRWRRSPPRPRDRSSRASAVRTAGSSSPGRGRVGHRRRARARPCGCRPA